LQTSPTAALYQASVAESPDALPPENQGSIRHGSAIPTTTAAVHQVRHHDSHSPGIRGGPTRFRGSMPGVRACRHLLSRLRHPTPVV